jgi:hypothetical protein
MVCWYIGNRDRQLAILVIAAFIKKWVMNFGPGKLGNDWFRSIRRIMQRIIKVMLDVGEALKIIFPTRVKG